MTRKLPVIVIVEDDTPTLNFLCELLEEEGYQTIGCSTAHEAYARIRREHPDLVILDAHLDGSDGGLIILEILRLTPATAELPIIVCSADASLLKEKAHELALANCGVVEKPFEIDRFVNIVRRMSSRPVPAQRPQAYHTEIARMTLRATRRLSQSGRSSRAKAAAVSQAVDRPTYHDLPDELQFEQETVQALLRSTQQLCRQSQLLTQEARRLREASSRVTQELPRTQDRLDTAAWRRALAGPQPQLWRKRHIYAE